MASLLFINGCTHLGGTIRARRCAPGVISGVLLYIPLSLYAFGSFVAAGQLSPAEGALSALLGAVYSAVPIGYLGLASAIKRA